MPQPKQAEKVEDQSDAGVAKPVEKANEANEKAVEKAKDTDNSEKAGDGVVVDSAGNTVAVEKAPGGFAKPPLRSEEDIIGDSGDDKPNSALDVLGKLSREELVRLQSFVSNVLDGQGTDSELRQDNGPTMADRVAGLSRDKEEEKDLDRKKVAKQIDLDDHKEILSYAVRSNGEGEKILVVVKNDGSKEYKEL